MTSVVTVPLEIPAATIWDNFCDILCDPEQLACVCVGILCVGILVRCVKLAGRRRASRRS